MKKAWVLERKQGDEWVREIANTNYYTFGGKVRNLFKEEDSKAISAFKESLGNSEYSEEIKQKFREVHNNVKSSFRVIQGEVPDENKSQDMTGFVFIQENEGVMKYLWSEATRYGRK